MMILAVLVIFLNLFAEVFSALIIARAVTGLFVTSPDNHFYQWLVGLTEPVLAPLRRVLPPMGMLDFSPFAAILLLQALQYLLQSLFGGS